MLTCSQNAGNPISEDLDFKKISWGAGGGLSRIPVSISNPLH